MTLSNRRKKTLGSPPPKQKYSIFAHLFQKICVVTPKIGYKIFPRNTNVFDGIDINWSAPDIDQGLKFTLDIGISSIPAVVDNLSKNVVEYLPLILNNISF